MSRARSVEIYLKPGIDEDDQVYDIWAALKGRGRPQHVFRRALRLGLREMAECGELPRAAMEMVDPDLLGPPAPARALMRGAQIRANKATPKEETPSNLNAAAKPDVQPPKEVNQKTAQVEPASSERVQNSSNSSYPDSVSDKSTQTPKSKLGRLM